MRSNGARKGERNIAAAERYGVDSCRRLLADRCPDCGRVQREHPFSRHDLPVPRRCGTRPSRTGDLAIAAGCGQDLTQAETLAVGHPALAAQRLILETIDSGAPASVLT
jgi:hypothetical protein